MITHQARDLAVSKSESGALLSLSELALVFDHGRDFVKAMARAGFKTFGGKTTREDALRWLRAVMSHQALNGQRERYFRSGCVTVRLSALVRPPCVQARNLFLYPKFHRVAVHRGLFLCEAKNFSRYTLYL